MSRPRCYIASPLGFTEAGRSYYTSHMLPAFAAVVEVVDPWAGVAGGDIDIARTAGTLREFWVGVGHRNLDLISSSQLLVAVLDGQEIDSGTAVELGFAAARGVRCFGLRTDARQAGEEGMRVNLQVEATVEVAGGRIAASLEQLVAWLGAES